MSYIMVNKGYSNLYLGRSNTMIIFIALAAVISLLSIEVSLRKTVKQNEEMIELLKDMKKGEE